MSWIKIRIVSVKLAEHLNRQDQILAQRDLQSCEDEHGDNGARDDKQAPLR